MMKCPDPKCGSLMDVVKPSADLKAPAEIKETDDQGKPLTSAAWLHYHEHRIRCRECGTNFCGQCKRMPYHIGYTCDQYQTYQGSRHCRFCSAALTPANQDTTLPACPALELVCTEADCQKRKSESCRTMLACGHPCWGIADEVKHAPCLHEDCVAISGCNTNQGDFCNICWTEEVGRAPAIQLECGHIFHSHCVRDKLNKKWPGW
jgi:hypothetical protein